MRFKVNQSYLEQVWVDREIFFEAKSEEEAIERVKTVIPESEIVEYGNTIRYDDTAEDLSVATSYDQKLQRVDQDRFKKKCTQKSV